jgi:hypothetical protein
MLTKSLIVAMFIIITRINSYIMYVVCQIYIPSTSLVIHTTSRGRFCAIVIFQFYTLQKATTTRIKFLKEFEMPFFKGH